MPLMVWTEALSVKVDEIDNQHKRLVDLLNQLHDAMLQGKGREAIGKTLNGLVDYTKTHFAYEQGLMAAQGYPAAAQHKAMHDELAQQVLELQSKYLIGKAALTLEVMRFLQDWLSNHIQKTDRQFGLFLNGKGIK
jgi:hemerythrin